MADVLISSFDGKMIHPFAQLSSNKKQKLEQLNIMDIVDLQKFKAEHKPKLLTTGAAKQNILGENQCEVGSELKASYHYVSEGLTSSKTALNNQAMYLCVMGEN